MKDNKDNKDKKDKKNKGAYIPLNAKMNKGVGNLEPPKTEYEERRVTFNRDSVKNIVGGEFKEDG